MGICSCIISFITYNVRNISVDKNVYIEMPSRKDIHLEEDPISLCNIDIPQYHKTSEFFYRLLSEVIK